MDHTTDTAPEDELEPTPDEEATAEANAADIDVEQVGKHYRESIEIGADVKGEGEIVPDPTP